MSQEREALRNLVEEVRNLSKSRDLRLEGLDDIKLVEAMINAQEVLDKTLWTRDGEDIANDVIDMLNVMGNKDNQQKFIQTLLAAHRTIQQHVMRLVILPLLEGFARAHRENWTDARNEAACKLAQKFLDAVPESERHLPYV